MVKLSFRQNFLISSFVGISTTLLLILIMPLAAFECLLSPIYLIISFFKNRNVMMHYTTKIIDVGYYSLTVDNIAKNLKLNEGYNGQRKN
jgi:hypothetical protein